MLIMTSGDGGRRHGGSALFLLLCPTALPLLQSFLAMIPASSFPPLYNFSCICGVSSGASDLRSSRAPDSPREGWATAAKTLTNLGFPASQLSLQVSVLPFSRSS